jgi:hypothetical protein
MNWCFWQYLGIGTGVLTSGKGGDGKVVQQGQPAKTPETSSAREEPEDDGFVYGRISSVSGGRVVIHFYDKYFYKVGGKAVLGVHGMPLPATYEGVRVGIPREVVESHAGGLYKQKLEERKSAGPRAVGDGRELGGSDLDALAQGEVVEAQKPVKGNKNK